MTDRCLLKGSTDTKGDLRLLALRNCDNKCGAGVCNWMAKPVLEASACSLQNVFTKSRIFLDSVTDLDHAGRVDALGFCESIDNAGLSFGAS